ncbi:cadherin-like domain-containing protein, partial [Nostoc sp.]|uniref:cadherin-like domain-containing protein n=1 Tax=Nostoc sp. TaxID=1180 RepID=UPI002FFA4B9A
MSLEFPHLSTTSTDVLSTTNLAPVLDEGGLTSSLTGLGRSNQSLLFVDRSVTDYEQLLAGVTTGTEIHVLDPGQDAVTQITNTLLGRQNIASLHIVSHGEAGGVDFGSNALKLTDLPQYAAQLKTWSKALTNDADILFYGCNVAEGQLGQAFVQNISQITGADVAASNNLTGKDGDWNLEVTTGKIESPLVFDSKVTSAYAYDLNILGETFKGSDVTNPSWIYNTTGTQPSLTARSTIPASTGGIPGGGGFDAIGSGALRLTSADSDQASFVIYNRPINASNGLSITFNIHAYGGDGADGISFFLINGNANPTAAGATGGSLGYSSSGSTPGLVGGYLGVGFDEFGNFSNPVYGAGGPDATPESIAIHGSQATGYKYLTGTATLPEGIDTPGNSRSAAQKKVQIDLTPAGLLSLKIDLNNDGDFLDNNETPGALQNYNVVNNNGLLPSTFKFGFSASTGGSTNIHEITGLDVDTFGGVPYTPLVNFTSSNGSVSEGASLNLTAQIDAVTSNTVTVPVTLSGTATDGTDYTLSNSTITIASGQLTGSITLNPIDNLVAGSNKTAVVTLGTPTNAQLSPQNNVFTTTIVDNDYSLSATGSSTYVENASPIVIAPTTTIVGGAAAPAINGATVSIGNGFSSSEDRLGIQGQSGTSGAIAGSNITWSYNTTSGVLALSGTDTAAKYQAALQQAVYSNLSDAPSTTTRAVTYTINYNSGQQATSTSAIAVTNVNDAPTISTNSLSLSQGSSVVLSSSNINATDPDNTPAQLTYTASSITGGRFELVAIPGVAITTFTQAQINSGAVRFVHNGGETAPSYSLIANDGSLNSGSSTVTGTFTNVNDAPTISTNSLSLSEGGSVVLSSSNINATDPDNTADQLIYTASSISGGRFEFGAIPGVAITSFTQAQINSGAVRFVHDGGETAPSYSLSVSDGSLNSGSSTVAIGTFTKVNDAPTISTNALSLSEGGSVVLFSSNINATDPDNTPAQLTYTASSISGGRFELVANAGVAITTFTQAQINSGAVRFVHNGGETAPSYSLIVNDGSLNSGSSTVAGTFTKVNDAPTISTNALSVSEGGSVVLSSSNINATDPDNTPAQLTYTASSISGGRFELVANAGVAITTFTQAQINSGAVRFVHGGSETAPSYRLIANDGLLSSGSSTVTIGTFTKVNDAPTISTNALSLSEGGSVVLFSSNINATDPDNTPAQLTYTASSISGGRFELVATPSVAITTFTQSQISSGAVRFVHGGGETAPSYSLIVNDGSLNSGSSTVTIGTFTKVNDAPTISTNSLSLSEGDSVVLSSSNINATDPDNTPAQLTYTASSITGGRFELVATPSVAITTFTQAQINSGAVRFVHDGGETAPSYRLSVSDGLLSSGSNTVTIGTFTNVNEAPTISTNSLSLSEGGSVVLFSSNINATDPDNTPAQLTYTASSISGGRFELVATPSVAITTFTQAQISSGAVRFVHDGGETAPSYSLIV